MQRKKCVVIRSPLPWPYVISAYFQTRNLSALLELLSFSHIPSNVCLNLGLLTNSLQFPVSRFNVGNYYFDLYIMESLELTPIPESSNGEEHRSHQIRRTPSHRRFSGSATLGRRILVFLHPYSNYLFLRFSDAVRPRLDGP